MVAYLGIFGLCIAAVCGAGTFSFGAQSVNIHHHCLTPMGTRNKFFHKLNHMQDGPVKIQETRQGSKQDYPFMENGGMRVSE